MAKNTKNRKKVLELLESDKMYSLDEACDLVKKITFIKFDASADLDVSLGVDPHQSNQMVRGVNTLPHDTGKNTK